jgi:hypothetical protein
MAGILAELGISWLLLWYVEGKNLEAIGLLPSRKWAIEFSLGFLYASLVMVAFHLGITSHRQTLPHQSGLFVTVFF